MTEEKLRNALKEATEKGKIGLLIWSCWRTWDTFATDMLSGCKHYDVVLSQVEAGDEAKIYIDFNGFTMLGMFAVPIQKLLSSDEFFTHILNICEKEHYEGPISFLPITEADDLS